MTQGSYGHRNLKIKGHLPSSKREVAHLPHDQPPQPKALIQVAAAPLGSVALKHTDTKMAMVTLKGLQGGRTLAGVSTGSRNIHALTSETPQLKQQTQQKKKMHQVMGSAPMPGPAHISMPPNVEELQASEKARFSPRRNRDVSSKLNQVGGVFGSRFMGSQGSQGAAFNNSSHPVDSHSDKYDSRITVSLSSVMQTNVPKPFEISGKAPVHLNMPGGQWAQDEKYISGDLHTFHHSNISSKKTPVE